MTKIDWDRAKRQPIAPARKTLLEVRADRYLEAVERKSTSKPKRKRKR